MRLYRWLLRLLPGQFRARRGEDLIAQAEEALQAASTSRVARLRVGARLAADVVASAWSLRRQTVGMATRQDLRYAARSLRRTPGFTAVAVLTLGIGLGANTTVFSLVNAFYFAPSEFPDPDHLVSIEETSTGKLCGGCSVGTSYPSFVEWRDRARAFDRVAAYLEESAVLSAPLTPQPASSARVGADLFDLLGVRPAFGRAFGAADDRPGAVATVILGHALWARAFGGDTAVLGRVVRINGSPAEIVGVMPAGFAFPERAELWRPLHADPLGDDRSNRNFGAIARLRVNVTIAQADAELRTIAADQARAHPETQKNWTASVMTLRESRFGQEGPAMLVMLGMVVLVLAVACTNLATLILSRSARRRREMALRAALGAGRARLAAQLLAENLVLGALGGGLGMLISVWGVRFAGSRIGDAIPYYIHVTIDWRVLAFCGAAAMMTGLLVGLLPATVLTRPDLTTTLKEGSAGAGTSRGSKRLRHGLLVLELSLVLILLSCAAFMGRSFLRMVERPGGYDMAGLTLAELPMSGARFADAAQLRIALQNLRSDLESQPNPVVGLAHTHFLRSFGAAERPIVVLGQPPLADGVSPTFAFAVSPKFFEAQGLRLLAGRVFDAGDESGAERPLIVNQRLADLVWPGRSPIGARIRLPLAEAQDIWWTVVGVVSNMEGSSMMGVRVQAFLYVPLGQLPGRPIAVLLRAAPGSAAPVDRLRAAVARMDPDEPVTDVRTAIEEHARQAWFVGYFAMFYLTFAAFALLLAAVGVYGVVSQAIGERTREFGIRIALGANRARLYRLVFGETSVLVGIGLGIGLVGTAAGTRLLAALLFGANPTDPLILGGACALLAATALAASYLPARRAANVDPVRALRAD